MDLRDASASKKPKINIALFFAASCGSLTLSPWMNVMQRNNNIKDVCTLGFGFVLCLFFSKTKSTFYHWRQHLCSARRQQNWRKRKKMCSCRERTAAQDLAAHREGGQLHRALPPSWGTAAIIERLQFSWFTASLYSRSAFGDRFIETRVCGNLFAKKCTWI